VLPYWDGNSSRAIYGGAFGGGSSTGVSFQSTTATNQNTTATNQNTGGGQAHDNVQPYLTARYLVAPDSTVRLLPGMLVHYATEETLSTAGTTGGWLMANGQAVPRAANPALFNALSTAFGAGDGATTFGLPTAAGRVLTGYDASNTGFDTLGEIGGAKTVTLSAAQMPSHTHTQTAHTHTQNPHSHGVNDGGHSHQQYHGWGGGSYVLPYWDGNSSRAIYGATSNIGRYSYISLYDTLGTNQNATATNNNTGGGQAHNEVQPYTTLNVLIHGGSTDGSQVKPTNTYAAPAGTVAWFAGTTPPSGWLSANGQAVSRLTYSTLFDAIGTTYGAGNGSGTFNTPNISGRSIFGRDTSQTEFDVLGETGGTKTETLTTAQLPSHTHSQPSHNHSNTVSVGSHSHSYGQEFGNAGDGNYPPASGAVFQWGQYCCYGGLIGSTTVSVGISNAAATATNQPTGGGQAHTNLQPYITLTPIVATGTGSSFEPGMMIATSAATTPTGWLEASGQTVSRTTFSALFGVAGTRFGTGDGSTTFGLPDLRGRVAVGVDSSQTEFDVLGETGGTKTVALTQAQMPSHTHTQNAHAHNNSVWSGAHAHNVGLEYGGAPWAEYNPNGSLAQWGGFYQAWRIDAAATPVFISNATAPAATSGATGSGAAHTNLAPYQAVRYLIAANSRLDLQSGMLLNVAASAAPTGSYTAGVTGRSLVGTSSSDTEWDVLGETGGAKTVTLAANEMPSHTHTMDAHSHANSVWAANHSHGYGVGFGRPGSGSYPPNGPWGSAWGQYAGYSGRISSESFGFYISNAAADVANNNNGSSQSHNNLQPYITLQSWSFNKALLSAVASSTTATLSWEPTASALRAGVAGYRVFRDGVQVCQTTATTCAISGLTAGTTYTWQVAPISGAGQGELSTAITSATLGLATGVTATVTSAGNVALTWTAPATNGGSSVVSYDYRFSTDAGSTWTTPVNTASVAASSALSSLVEPRAYLFQIRPVNGAGLGTWSASSAPVVTIEPTLAAYGATRTNLIPQPSLEFSPVSGFGAAAAVKERSTEQARTGTASWKTTLSSTTDSNISSANAGITVPQAGTYTVSAYFYVPSGSALAGRTVTFTAEGGTTAAYANGASYPATLVAGSWARASRTITFASVPATHPMLVGRISGDLTAAVGSVVYSDDWLYESAAAAGPYFDGASSNAFWAGTAHNSTSQHAIGNQRVLLAWDPPISGGAIADYAVQFRTGGGTWAPFNDGVSSAQTATVTGLSNLTAYEFRVAAVSGGAQGLWSNVVTATPNDLPSQPLAPTAQAGATSAVVSWAAPQYLGAGTVEYEVSVWDSTGTTAGLASNAARLTGSATTSYTFTGLQQGEQYTFKVRTKNAAGFSGYSITSNVVFLALIPAGVVVPFAGGTIPSGWLEANGQAVSRTTFAQLYGALTTTYGTGDGTTTFNVPDLRTRTAVMVDGTQTEFDVLGETGGSAALVLSETQLPSHTHGLGSFASATGGNHDHRAGVSNGFAGDLDIAIDNGTGSDGGRYSFTDSYTDANHPSSFLYADSQGAHTHSFSGSTATTGTSTAHNELQPYLTLRYIIATTDLSALPAGSLVASASSNTPANWVLADGAAVSRSANATLFSQVGDVFGAGDGSTTFLLPNAKGRVVVGRDTSNTQFDTLGETGGALTHTLTQAEMPSHAHAPGSLTSNSLGAHTHTMRMSSGSFAADLTQIAMSNGSGGDGMRYAVRDSATDASHPNSSLYARSNGGHTHAVTGTSAAAGGSAGVATAHENTQPYLTTRWLVATTDATVPVGAMLYSASATTTPGWLETAGTSVSRTTHAGLFAALGTQYGVGDGSTTFNLPNVRGRVAVGTDSSQTLFDALGETGGAKTVTLALAQVPSHTHTAGTLTLASGGVHTHNIRASGSFAGDLGIAMTNNCCSDGARYGMGDSGRDASWANSFMYAQATGDHTHTLSGSTAAAGSDAAHSNLQPYVALVQMVYSGAVVTGAPATPFGVSATAAANQVSVSWSAVADNSVTPLTGYRVFRNGVQVCQVAKPTLSCVDSAISGGVTYSYQVAAYGSNGQGSMSYAVTATPWTAPSAPSITTTTANDGSITISFTASAANGATLTAYQYSLSGGAWTNFANTSLTQTVSGLANGTYYTLKVRGVNAAGGGAESNTVGATPFTVPAAPNISFSGGHDRAVYVAWSANGNGGSGITGYNVDISTDSVNWSRWLTNTGATNSWYGGLARTPTTYWFRVQANNARGSSAWTTSNSNTGWSTYIGFQEGFYVGWILDGRNGYWVMLQGDNNLVQYAPWGARWARGCGGGYSGSYLGMQGDTNLVLYCLPSWNAAWASSFEGSFGYSFKQESDGLICLKSGWSGDGGRNRCW
jgi:titin